MFASISGAVMMAPTLTHLALIPHPTGSSIAAVVVIGIGTLLGSRRSSTIGR